MNGNDDQEQDGAPVGAGKERWRRWMRALIDPRIDEARLAQTLEAARARHPLPVLWLLGKSQAGKTSIIQALTGSEYAEVGNGFQPCTRTARFYEFPPRVPVVRFLDTRGLGEVAYDPDEDIRVAESQAHLLLGVMKVGDGHQEAVFEVLREVRTRHPEWPLVIAQTGLHELYPPGGEHIEPWPYADAEWPAQVPVALARAIRAQRAQAGSFPGMAPVRWVALDLTQPEDGYAPVDYGLEALWEAIDEVSSVRLAALLRGDDEVRDLFAQSAHPHIVGYAMTAAVVGALPAVDLVGVPSIQAKMLQSLAALYGQTWERRAIAEFLGLLGVGIGASYATHAIGRSLIKFIPVVGQTVGALWGASSSGAATYALGKTAGHYFNNRSQGRASEARVLRRIFAEQLRQGAVVLRASRGDSHDD